MKPIDFSEQNVCYAVRQPEYLPLPAHRTDDGLVISCWKLSWYERFKIIFTGKVWLSVLTFNSLLQPQRPSIHKPEELL